MRPLDQRTQTTERPLPMSTVIAHPASGLFKRHGIELTHLQAPVPARLHQVCALEIRQMLRDSLLRHLKGPGEIAHRRRSGFELREDGTPCWIGQRGKGHAQCIHNRMVVYNRAHVKPRMTQGAINRPTGRMLGT